MKTHIQKPHQLAKTLQPSFSRQVLKFEDKRLEHIAQARFIKGIMQRKVGLEFQTHANLWTEPEMDKDEGWGEDIDLESAEVIKGRRKLLYGDKVFKLDGLFHIESDDGEVEFVSEPFEEDQEGYNKLTMAVALMNDMANLIYSNPGELEDVAILFGMGTYDTTRSFKDEGKEEEESEEEEEEEEKKENKVYVGNIQDPGDVPDLLASPQATIGIRLDKIIEMFEKVLSKRELSSFALWSDRKKESLPKHRSQKVLESGLQSAKEYKNHPVNNFSFLVKSYLLSAKEYSPDLADPKNYPKIAFPIMARNSFKSIFQELSEQDQLWFNRYSHIFVKIAGRKLEEPLFTEGYYDDQGTFHSPESVVKIKEWLESITQISETPDKLSTLSGMMVGRGMGAVPTLDEVRKIDETGTPIESSRGALFELRRMMTNIPPDEWVELAQLVHQTMNEINEAKVYETATIDIEQEKTGLKDGKNSIPDILNEHSVAEHYYE